MPVHKTGQEEGRISVRVLAGIKVIFSVRAHTVQCLGFGMRITLITHQLLAVTEQEVIIFLLLLNTTFPPLLKTSPVS